jgi:hypothetical protein
MTKAAAEDAMEDPFASEGFDGEDEFSSPPSGERITAFKGKLVLVWPKRYNTGIATKFGEKDGVDVDIVVLEKDGTGKLYEEVGILQSALVGKLKRRVGGKPMLGVVYQRPTDKGNPAWDLDQPTEAQKDIARKYLATR